MNKKNQSKPWLAEDLHSECPDGYLPIQQHHLTSCLLPSLCGLSSEASPTSLGYDGYFVSAVCQHFEQTDAFFVSFLICEELLADQTLLILKMVMGDSCLIEKHWISCQFIKWYLRQTLTFINKGERNNSRVVKSIPSRNWPPIFVKLPGLVVLS